MKKLTSSLFASLLLLGVAHAGARAPLVLLTDFGTRDGAVSAVKGVAYGVSQDLLISDLTHEAGDIFTAGYRLSQAENFWPRGTVFVTVVDPGVGTPRRSIVLKTRTGHYFVGPDNGLLTLVAERDGIAGLREIDERVNRRQGSGDSHTFHGRDVYGYTGARLASGKINFEQVGPLLPPDSLVTLPYQHATLDGSKASGIIPVLDIQFGNVWTNIPKTLFDQLGTALGERVHVRIQHGDELAVEIDVPYERTFGQVPVGQPLLYVNSLLNVSLALNQGNFAAVHKIGSGVDWRIELRRAESP